MFRIRLPLILTSMIWSLVSNSLLLAQGQQKTSPVFEDGQAQIVPAFNESAKWIRHDLFVETEFDSDNDGQLDRMHVSVCRPRQTQTQGLKVPAIYITSPYFAGTSSTDSKFMWNPRHELNQTPPERLDPPAIEFQKRRPVISYSHVYNWVPRGFAVVHSCSPGTGLSQGCPTIGGENESLAPKAVIDWLCGRATGYTSRDGEETVSADWCTGKVGMTGTSYNGTLCLAAATTGVEGLEAIIPIAPNTSYYHYYRANGLVRHPGGYMGEDTDVLYNFVHSGNPEMREKCNCDVRDNTLAAGQDRITGDYNDFWKQRDYLHQADKIQTATLLAHGLNDWNVMPSHSIRFYQALKNNKIPLRLYLHQGGHGGGPPKEMMNRWFTRYLYEIENAIESEPPVYVVREGAKSGEPTAYDDYPHPDSQPVEFFPGGEGLKVGQLVIHRVAKQGLTAITDNVEVSGSELAQAAEAPHRLLYVTQPIAKPLHISGTPRVSIKLASNKPAANLSVWLVSLPWNDNAPINANLITRGWADPQNSQSLTESEPLVPGKFYELKFNLEPDDHIVPAGQQIGLMIFSSDREFTLWPKPGTELTIDVQATSIQLPIVGGEKAIQPSLIQ